MKFVSTFEALRGLAVTRLPYPLRIVTLAHRVACGFQKYVPEVKLKRNVSYRSTDTPGSQLRRNYI